MKFLKKFSEHKYFENYTLDFTNTPNISKCILENEIHYQKKLPPHYNLFDILYVDSNGKKKVDSNILDPSEGYIPIGLCVVETNFFGENELARFMSLKWMNYNTPDSGSGNSQGIAMGNKGTYIDIQARQTYINGTRDGYLTADWITGTNNKVPSLFDENNNWNLTELGNINQYAVTQITGKQNTNILLDNIYTSEQPNWKTDSTLTNTNDQGYSPAACCCWRYHTLGTQQGDWYWGSAGETAMIVVLKQQINNKLAQIYSLYSSYCINSLYTATLNTSTRYDTNGMWMTAVSNGSITYTYSGGASGAILAFIQY